MIKTCKTKGLSGREDSVFEKSEHFCPHCGKRNLWREAGCEDYYMGARHLCSNCGGSADLDSAMTGENFSSGWPNHPALIKALKLGESL